MIEAPRNHLEIDPRRKAFDAKVNELSGLSDEQIMSEFDLPEGLGGTFQIMYEVNLDSRTCTVSQVVQRAIFFKRGAVFADKMLETARVGDYRVDEKQKNLAEILSSSRKPFFRGDYRKGLPVTDPGTHFGFMADTLVNWQVIGERFPYVVESLEKLAPRDDVDALFFKYGTIAYIASKAKGIRERAEVV